MNGRKTLHLSLLWAALSCLAAAPASASAITDALLGGWSGSGRLTLPNGQKERIRCDGTTSSTGADAIRQHFTCASASGIFSFSSTLSFAGGRVQGSWSGPNRSGAASGSATGSSVQLQLSSSAGSGALSASVNGCSQSLTISGWASELRSLSVQLSKAGC